MKKTKKKKAGFIEQALKTPEGREALDSVLRCSPTPEMIREAIKPIDPDVALRRLLDQQK